MLCSWASIQVHIVGSALGSDPAQWLVPPVLFLARVCGWWLGRDRRLRQLHSHLREFFGQPLLCNFCIEGGCRFRGDEGHTAIVRLIHYQGAGWFLALSQCPTPFLPPPFRSRMLPFRVRSRFDCRRILWEVALFPRSDESWAPSSPLRDLPEWCWCSLRRAYRTRNLLFCDFPGPPKILREIVLSHN